MKSHYQAVVIGGGIVGASVLYHLTKLGWKDVALLERKQLTAGSTWHAAAGFHSLNGDPNIARLQSRSIDLYREIQEISGQDVGLHVPGGIVVASSEEKWTFIKSVHALNQTLGIESELVTPEQVSELTPLIKTSDLKGGLWDPHEGHLDPYGATHAFAKCARIAGAEIHLQTLVQALNQQADGSWEIVTDKGTVRAEHVVNAAGLWAREVGRMAGVDLPLVPFEHHYLVTENIPELAAFGRESCVIADVDGEIYVRQEQQGALFGVYEKGAVPWAVNGTPWEYGETDLLPSRLDDLAETLERGFERFPTVAEAGIKRIVNGPFTFTPDGNPLVGPVPDVRNYWSACGVMAGFSQGGGIGLSLARWMVEGEPEGDVFGMDVARFGKYATQPYVVETARQFYETRMNVPFPNEVYPAGRPNRTSPIYDLHKAQNAVFGAMFGLEVPLWFAPDGEEPRDIPGFYRHNNAFASVRSEAIAAREAVTVLDVSSFAKFEITGTGASAWLDKLLASKLPEPGCAGAAVMLSGSAAIIGDLTLMCLDRQRYLLTGSGALQVWYMRRFSQYLPAGDVQVVNVTDHYSCLVLIGPQSREVLKKLTSSDVSNESFPYMSLQETTVGYAPAKVIRKSIAGELGYEIYVPSLHMRSLYEQIMAVGDEYAIRNLGVRALLSLMLEKGAGSWGREYSPDYTPSMNSMSSYIDYGKPGFVGREAAIADRDKVPERKLVMLEVRSDDSDPRGFEPVYRNGRIVGHVTSGGYGFRVNKSLAMAYIDTDAADPEVGYEVNILGELRAARLLTHVPYDPEGLRIQM